MRTVIDIEKVVAAIEDGERLWKSFGDFENDYEGGKEQSVALGAFEDVRNAIIAACAEQGVTNPFAAPGPERTDEEEA